VLLISAILSGLLISSSTAYADDPPVFPSCAGHDSPGPDGIVTVRMNPSGLVQWGVKMIPPEKSVGQWALITIMGGKKTTSGFNRFTTGPYIPHGVVSETKPGLVFAVRGVVYSTDGHEYFVYGTPCRVPA